MIIVEQAAELKQAISQAKSEAKAKNATVALVPTMGALHRGHLELIRIAKAKAEICVVSIFVNPTQFLAGEDLERYPKPIDQDIAACESMDVDILFCPKVDQMYEHNSYIGFSIDTLANGLCGKSRPGHFEGVIQIVNKLFNLVQPEFAVFGQKDYQQFRIIEQMVEEFMHPVNLVMAPITRDFDGLALSSRNRYLSAEERKRANSLYKALDLIKNSVLTNRTIELQPAKQILTKAGLKIDYIGVYDVNTLQPITSVKGNAKCVAAGAVYVGKTRLIDNLLFSY